MMETKQRSNSVAICIKNLSCYFGALKAVDDISMEIPSGTIFGLLGPNGAGKTTTIRLLLGLLKPTSGSAEILGFNPWTNGQEVRSRIGVLLENTGLYENLTAEENLDFYGRVNRMPSVRRQERIEELLTLTELWGRRKEFPATWSKGMRQKLALARAMIHLPQVLLLDEPTVGLDVNAAVAIRDYLHQIVKKDGVTVFLTTHNMTEAEKYCNNITVIKNGRMVAHGTPESIRSQTSINRWEVRGGCIDHAILEMVRKQANVLSVNQDNDLLIVDLRPDSNISVLVKLLVDEGVQVWGVRPMRDNFEEVFLELTEEKNNDK
ncbi:MAG TPA: ABC transporter ATP-binding protein [Anaerolineaceae bacterium]|nr:ABC transporter ATP-binding protein [Anaerolineaceae bacterium]